MSISSANITSARFLAERAEQMWEHGSEPDLRRLALINDLYIKARSYAIVNKIAFWATLLGAFLVLAWPSAVVMFTEIGINSATLQSAFVQTSITGIAAFTYACYSHYKNRQCAAEGLMRHVFYSDSCTETLIMSTLEEIGRLDNGFGFSEFLKGNKPDPN